MKLSGTVELDGVQRGFWTATRRPEVLRREPEPHIGGVFADRPLGPIGNDIHGWDWTVTYDGRTVSNLEESPLEWRTADGYLGLAARVLELGT